MQYFLFLFLLASTACAQDTLYAGCKNFYKLDYPHILERDYKLDFASKSKNAQLQQANANDDREVYIMPLENSTSTELVAEYRQPDGSYKQVKSVTLTVVPAPEPVYTLMVDGKSYPQGYSKEIIVNADSDIRISISPDAAFAKHYQYDKRYQLSRVSVTAYLKKNKKQTFTEDASGEEHSFSALSQYENPDWKKAPRYYEVRAIQYMRTNYDLQNYNRQATMGTPFKLVVK